MQKSRAFRWAQNRSIHNGSTSRGSMSTPMGARQEEVAAYQHSQSSVPWHLLKGNTEIGADVFTSSEGRWTLNIIILFHDYNADNTLHLKNFQVFSTFPPCESAFPTIRSSPNIFQAFLGHQVHVSHSRSCMAFLLPQWYLPGVIHNSKSPRSSKCIAAQAGGHFGPF